MSAASASSSLSSAAVDASLISDIESHNDRLRKSVQRDTRSLVHLTTVLTERPKLLARVLAYSSTLGPKAEAKEIADGVCPCDISHQCQCMFTHPVTLHRHSILSPLLNREPSAEAPEPLLELILQYERNAESKSWALGGECLLHFLSQAMGNGLGECVRLLYFSRPNFRQVTGPDEASRLGVVTECCKAGPKGAEYLALFWPSIIPLDDILEGEEADEQPTQREERQARIMAHSFSLSFSEAVEYGNKEVIGLLMDKLKIAEPDAAKRTALATTHLRGQADLLAFALARL